VVAGLVCFLWVGARAGGVGGGLSLIVP